MNIVTDNSAVIEALNKRIEKLESYNAGLANESCEQQSKIRELERKNAKMLECLCDISNACIGQITMSYSLDAEDIGQSIYVATGMKNPQMNASLKEPKT
jgi:predicted nuclease with TOPRIM domain